MFLVVHLVLELSSQTKGDAAIEIPTRNIIISIVIPMPIIIQIWLRFRGSYTY